MKQQHEWSTGGQTPLDLLRQEHFESAVINDSIPWPETVSGIIIVGASASGKTTLVDSIRNEQGIDRLYQVAERAIERERRDNDDLTENVLFGVEPDEWGLVVEEGFTVQLQKPSGGGVETYYFRYQNDGRIPIFPANLGVLQLPEHVFPRSILDNALVIGVEAPVEVRRQRFEHRSKDIISGRPEEASFRMQDVGDLVVRNSHITLQNWGGFEDAASQDLQAILLKLSGSLECHSMPQPMHTTDGGNGFPQPNAKDFYLDAKDQLQGVDEFMSGLQELVAAQLPMSDECARTLARYVHVATRLSMPDARLFMEKDEQERVNCILTGLVTLSARLPLTA